MQLREIRRVQTRPGRGAARPDDVRRLLRQTVVEHAVAALQDPGLRPGDLRKRAAEDRGVIVAQVADHGKLRAVDDVGGIQRAAEADLEHNDVAALLCKPEHGKRRDQFEFGRMLGHGLGLRARALRQRRQRPVGDRHAVALHPLVEAHEEGRGIKPGARARCAEDRGQHRRRRALAVRPGDVDEAQALLRVAQTAQQLPRARKSRPRAAPAHIMQIGQCLLNRHAVRPPPSPACASALASGSTGAAVSRLVAAPISRRSKNTPKIT